MADDTIFSVLHLSDFHFSKRRQIDQEIVVDALIKDLTTLCIGHRRPDLIVFTGDLVQAAGVDRHDEAYDVLLGPVAHATSCSEERIFIVPGNHDLSQNVVDKTRSEHSAWRDQAENMEALNALYSEHAFSEIAKLKFLSYCELERNLSDGMAKFKNDFVKVFYISPLNINLVILNTSMLSVGGHKDLGTDQNKLIIPEYPLLEALKHLEPSSYRIFASHHPVRTLSEAGARFLQKTIEANAHVHLFGHMHDPEGHNTTSFHGQLFSAQAGAIFTQRKNAYIGYSLISIERSESLYETHLRTYFDDRRAFDEARDVLPQGKYYSSQKAREFWRKIATPIEEHTLRDHLSGSCLNELLSDEEKVPGERDLHKMFVSPPMKRTSIRHSTMDDANSIAEAPVTFDELLSGEANVIIYAAPEYGRTTVIKELQYKLLTDAKALRYARLPVIIDFCDIKQNANNLLKLVKSRALTPPDGVDIESLMKLGHACILFDDVIFSDIKSMQILREFVTNYPKVRYIFSSPKNSAAPLGAHVVPEMPVHFDYVELCVLRRREMRELVVKFGGHSDVDGLLDRLQSEFQEINLPFTAANGSILMAIYEEQSGFHPINRSVLIEQFIDTTLRKAAVEQSRRETFDYANKTALLAHIAGWMAKCDSYVPFAEDVRTEIRNYLDDLGLNVPIDQLMSEFLTSRIFIKRPDERLSFRYRAVLEYFIAMQMRENAAFKDWIMEETRYLQFVNEIHYYAGKLRKDADLIDEVGRRFSETLRQIIETDGVIDLNLLTTLKLPGKKDTNLDHLSDQLMVPPMTQEERDAELEADLPRDIEERQEVFRPQIENPAQKLLVALFLYSGLLKNMELITDEKKRYHLNEIWKGWSIFLHLSLSFVPQLAYHRRMRINGVLYEINAPHGMSDTELARAISLSMPTAVSKVITAALGTEKLERQLTLPSDVEDNPMVFELLRTFLIADLRLSGTGKAITAALDDLRPSAYLLEALIWKIADLRRLGRLSEQAFDGITPRVAEAIAHLKGGSRQERDQEKRGQVKRLQQQGLLLRIKRQNESE